MYYMLCTDWDRGLSTYNKACNCNLFYVKYWPVDDLDVGPNTLP